MDRATEENQSTSGAGKYEEIDHSEPLETLRHLLSAGEILPAQLPSPSNWSPELRLAASVLAQSMADIRLRRPDGRDHIQVAAAVRWVRSNDSHWPLAFCRVCELLQLEPEWVRDRVNRWIHRDLARGRSAGYRKAA